MEKIEQQKMKAGIAGLTCLVLLGCGGENEPASASTHEARREIPSTQTEEQPNRGAETMALKIESTAFGFNQPIPQEYSGDGKDLSPPLTWSGVPDGTQELALICDDPDAPMAEPFVHWVLYKIPDGTTELPEGIPAEETLSSPQGALQGRNDFDRIGYGGPAPPKGHGVHHYHFKLYALDQNLDVRPGLTKKDLLQAMEGHILAQAEWIGTYER